MKLYECQYPGCKTLSQIRTKVKDKDSEYYGLYMCSYHGNLLRPKKVSEKTRRTQTKRKEQRKDYPQFYQSMIELCQGKCCIETGDIINDPSSVNIVHILAKSTSPEVATNPDNIVFMTWEAHSKFDSSLESRREMKCLQETIERYELLKPFLTNITAETEFYENYLHM